jgi:hypothetical protein
MRVRRRIWIRSRVWKFLFWGTILVLASVSGGLWFAYAYVTDSATVAGMIRAEAPRYLPGSQLDLGRVRVRPFAGEIAMSHVAVRQPLDGALFLVSRLPWLHIQHDARAMFKGRFVPREVVVAQPTLRLRRRKDGTWNFQGLLADPWPGPPLKETPPVLIQNGTVELVEGDDSSVAVLREVMLKVESTAPRVYQFEGSARGDAFDRVSLQGTIDTATGRVALRGDVSRLAVSDTSYRRLPVEIRAQVKRLGLTSGEMDIRLAQVVYDPNARPKIRYDASARLRAGVWNCPKLPFPLNDLAASVTLRDDVLTIERAEGYNGTTTARAAGTLTLGDPERAPLNLLLHVIDLELDHRLHAWTPPEFADLWDEYRPRGRVSVSVQMVRAQEAGPVGFGMRVDCRDVAMLYRHFKYPLDHVQGTLIFERQQIRLDMRTLVGNKPLRATGTIDNPGPDAHVQLDFEGEALPIDKTLFDAIPPDVRAVVKEFQPTGTVRGRAHVERIPPAGPNDDPKGTVKLDAALDLNERCAIKWAGLPYPVENLTGRLELHPNLWIFKDMRGSNGQAVITGSGRVEKLATPWTGPGEPLLVDLLLNAEKLPFDDQLREALPPAWRKSWATINPIGSSDVAARIQVAPGRPDDYHLVIDPRPSTGIHLQFTRAPQPGIDLGGTFELPMEHIKGRFVFHNGTVTMKDVGFLFHDAPVEFADGTVVVADNGRFRLGVKDLRARDFRLDAQLRRIMPPVMAQFARRLDDGKTFRVNGNLRLAWSGRDKDPVLCEWDKAKVILNDNTIQAGLPLEHLQGQLDSVWGRFNGESLEVHGALQLESISLLGQQVTRLGSPIDVQGGVARLSDIRGSFLGGEIAGRFAVSLDAIPHYNASIVVQGADLERYAQSLPGHQNFRGQVYGRLDLNGFGNDLHTLQGQGEAHIVRGDLGELPGFLRLVKLLNLSPATKTAFDSADIAITIRDGKSLLDPIRFTGDAFSLHGRGTLDLQGDLDLRLRVLYGRDTLRLRLVSDALREASGQFFIVHVLGTPAFPKFKLEPLPQVSDRVKSLGQRRAEQRGRPGAGGW